jgi:adenosylcobinamide-GDP ribazoletransferase
MSTDVAPGRGLLAALGLFTVLPVPARRPGPGVLLWLPVVGLLLAGLAFLPALAVWRGGGLGSPFLAAVLVVVGFALLTGGLHLDGAADLADGLGSRRPADQALAIMRRPDVGAFGIVAVVCTLLLQVGALSAVLGASSRPVGLFAVALAAVTARVAVLQAAGLPVSAGSWLGVLVAGGVPAPWRWAAGAVVLLGAGVGPVLLGGNGADAVWSVGAALAGLLAATVLARHAVRRLGGVSGDVFGALIEGATTVTLVVLAAGTAWQ